MSNSGTARDYILRMMELCDNRQHEEAVKLRKAFFAADDKARTLTDESLHLAVSRPELLSELAEICENFWQLPKNKLSTQLARLASSKYPEVAIKAARLLKVAENHTEFSRLAADSAIHPAFRNAIKQIVVLPASQANAIKELQFSHLRPLNNDAYVSANHAIKSAVDRLRKSYPAIFSLEPEWFNELFYYQPNWDLDLQEGNMALGCAVLALVVFALGAFSAIISAISDGPL